MKFLYTISLILAIATTGNCSLFSLFSPSWGFQSNEIIQNNEAVFPLCFPNGFPYSTWGGGCYDPDEFPTSYQGNLPCLPAIITGQKIIPCGVPYVTITSYNGPPNGGVPYNGGGGAVPYGPGGSSGPYYQY